MPLAAPIILYGPDASSNELRRKARCTRCGTLGAVTSQPRHVHGLRRAGVAGERRGTVASVRNRPSRAAETVLVVDRLGDGGGRFRPV